MSRIGWLFLLAGCSGEFSKGEVLPTEAPPSPQDASEVPEAAPAHPGDSGAVLTREAARDEGPEVVAVEAAPPTDPCNGCGPGQRCDVATRICVCLSSPDYVAICNGHLGQGRASHAYGRDYCALPPAGQGCVESTFQNIDLWCCAK